MHSTLPIALALTLGLVGLGCSDRSVDPNPIQFERPDDDGDPVDMGIEVEPVDPDGICDGQPDGVSCSLSNATGVCVRQRCRLVACESGFDDCDDEPGCETDVRTTASCGACDISCVDDELCQRGPGGFICNVGTVCPIDRFDLDGDLSNGCEWEAVWESEGTIVPADLAVEAAAWNDVAVLAGSRDGSRISTRVGQSPDPVVWDVAPQTAAQALRVQDDGEVARTVWQDGVGVYVRANQGFDFTAPSCEAASVERELVAATESFVATQFDVFEVVTDASCEALVCLEPWFRWGNYLRTSYPHTDGGSISPFEPDELTNCSDCLFEPTGAPAVPLECVGARHCRPDDFDTSSCGTCNAAGCPTLEIVGLRETENILFVVTARGFVAIDRQSGAVITRREVAFDPDSAAGTLFVGSTSADSTDSISLLHSDGSVSAVAIGASSGEAVPLFGRFGVEADLAEASIAEQDGIFGVVSAGTAFLARPADASARVAFLTMESAPGIQGLAPFAVVESDQGLRVLYSAAGQLFSRLIRRSE